jgi:uncharacterized membrane-anchored protein YhcB (DUF1043 family)
MMLWMVALGCLLAGALLGAGLFKLLRSDEIRVQQLESQLQHLSDEYENYKKEVHGHFSDSAILIGKMTESYREVYQHLAEGARNLCPDYIAAQMTQLPSPDSLTSEEGTNVAAAGKSHNRFSPPLDYVLPGHDGSSQLPERN